MLIGSTVRVRDRPLAWKSLDACSLRGDTLMSPTGCRCSSATLDSSDDVETQYHQMVGGTSGGPKGKRGHTDFLPAVPANAKSLTVTWDEDIHFEVPLGR